MVRWLPFARADGATNMAADDVLLAAEQGIASLRFYGWSQATLSLGYFQAAELRKPHALSHLPWVRRPSGGKALIHHHELTYALALPPGFSSGWMQRMHARIILPALSRLGVKLQVVASQPHSLGEFLCFQQHTAGDLALAENKVVGSAQRKHRQSLLQHGAILLAQSEHAPELLGIKELTGIDLTEQTVQGVILEEFRRETGWKITEGEWTGEEEKQILAKVAQQYGTIEWNGRR